MSKDFLQNQGPAHVAIIMDGNGRWAELRKRPRLLGHYAGARRVREIVESCPTVGVKFLTIFAFSTENWKRTQSEVSGLMNLFRRYIQREAQNLKKQMVRVRFIGDRRRLAARRQLARRPLPRKLLGRFNVLERQLASCSITWGAITCGADHLLRRRAACRDFV